MTASLDSFETALLSRLREHVDQPLRGRRRVRPRLLLCAAAVVAAVAGVFVVLPGSGNAAYSVQEGTSGTITVEVHRLEDAEGLEADLATYGVKADVTYVPDGRRCAPGRYTPVDRSRSGLSVSMGSRLLRVTLPSGTIRDGETFVMAVSGKAIAPSAEPPVDGVKTLGGFSSWADFDVTAGPVRPCRVVG